MSRNDELEFNVVGCRVRFNPAVDGGVKPQEVVELVRREAVSLKQNAPKRTDAEIAVLVALKLASEKIAIESEYRQNIDKLENSISDALEFVEQVSPTTTV